jgi:predicted porin
MNAPKKTLLAAALALAGSAQAASVVEMYGTVFPFFDSAETKNATTPAPSAAEKPTQVATSAYTGANDPRRTRITVGTTSWGFRGYEDLAPGLRAVWQLESGFQIDQNVGPGIGARDSKVGLAGPAWGEIFLGQWDTPYKYVSLPVNPLRAGYVFDRTAITGNPGMGVGNTTTQFTRIGAKPDASFDRRQGNSVQYWSPTWGGVSFRVQHSVNEGRGAIVAGGPVISPTVNSFSAVWSWGALSLRYAYEEHRDYFGLTQLGGGAAGTLTNPGSKDTGHKFVWLYRIGNTRFTGLVEQLKYTSEDTGAGNVREYKRNAWYFVLEQFFAANKMSVFGSYGQAANGTCSRVGPARVHHERPGREVLHAGLHLPLLEAHRVRRRLLQDGQQAQRAILAGSGGQRGAGCARRGHDGVRPGPVALLLIPPGMTKGPAPPALFFCAPRSGIATALAPLTPSKRFHAPAPCAHGGRVVSRARRRSALSSPRGSARP